MDRKVCIVFVVLALTLASTVEARPDSFDISSLSAGSSDISQALLKAWKEACESPDPSSIVIPKGTYLLNPILLEGPCKAPVDFQIQGTVTAPEDPKVYKGQAWVTFHRVDGLTMSGGGIFDAKGATTWARNECHKTVSCHSLPISLSFSLMTNGVVQDITSKDSKFFHVNVIGSANFTFNHFRVSAPPESLNTDGIHIGRSKDIKVLDSVIETGDDCVSLGDGARQVAVTNVTCGPGHGISIGSLGKYDNEEPVEDVRVKNCTLINTTNGVRIKTWPGSPAGVATDIHFDDIIMQNVTNPILIDQEYCPWNNCQQGKASKIKLSKISFNNIKGTSAFPLAIILVCSRQLPCETVQIGNVDLKYEGPLGPMTTKCANIKPEYTGTQNPKICANDTQSA